MKIPFTHQMKEMDINPFNLSFGGFRENRFLHYYSSITIRDARLAWYLGIFIYAIFGIHDLVYNLEQQLPLLIVRYLVICPLLLIILVASYHRLAAKYIQIMISMAIMICGLGIVYSLIYIHGKEASSSTSGLMLLFLYAFTFSRARFLYVATTVLLLIISFEFAEIYINKNEMLSFVNVNFYLLTAVIIGLFATYMIEFFMRRNYYLMNLVKKEKLIVENNQRSLEMKIHERTEVLNTINKQLQQEIDKKILIEKELKKARDEAERASMMKSAYLANMSHEIRTPMNGILGFAQLLKQNNFSEEKKKEFIDIINDNGKLLLSLIDDIIDLAKIEAGQLRVVKTWFNINELLTRLNITYQLNKTTRRKENINLFLKLPPGKDNLMIFSDEKRLEQVLSNLLDNALKFTEEGYIEFGFNCSEDNIIFHVKDSGIGMSPGQAREIFERFNQGDISPSKYGGAGLGLSICKAIVGLLHGKIWVESELTSGSVFYISLPIEMDKRINIDSTNENNSSNLSTWIGKTLLVAEDEEINYSLIHEILKETEVNILHASNGKEAINILLNQQNKIDLILMDIKMPVMNGYDTIHAIRNLNTDIPIIAQSAYAMRDEIQKCISLGCNDYITKPISAKEFINCIGKYLN